MTASGAMQLLPVAYRPTDPFSLYSRLVASGPRLNISLNFVGMFTGNITGSVKRDAYNWAINFFIRTGLSNPLFLAYYIDAYWASLGDTDGWDKATLQNRDYFVSNRAFFFDLSPWDDEAPVDEPSQPLGSDLAAFRSMLQACNAAAHNSSFIRIGGFTPWA